MTKHEDFSAWYNDLIERAGLIDKRYPIKGMDVWLPYGLKVRTLLDARIHDEMQRTGHDEYQFPLLIPKTEFAKEAEHIQGFDAQVFWVTHGGRNELDIPLVLRPTSETAMYPMFSVWIRSHAELPFKIYQIVSVFRYETKQTRSFIRVREIHFFESHTAHADYDDAERQVVEDLEILERLSRDLCMPLLLHKRPEWDKFAGAFYSIGADVLMPELRALQLASVHHYKDNFAKPYDIKYEKEDGSFQHVHQTTYGMSERIVGAIVGIHGDDKGLRLPPAVAPVQAIIVPILFKGKEAPVLDACRAAATTLAAGGVRARVDDSEQTAGFKFNEWELKGVPLRVEIGPRDVEEGKVVLVPRDAHDAGVAVASAHGKTLKSNKLAVPAAELAAACAEQLNAYALRLRASADRLVADNVPVVKTLDDARKTFGILKSWWCGADACAKEVETRGDKTVLGFPRGVRDGAIVTLDSSRGGCIACGAETDQVIHLAKTY